LESGWDWVYCLYFSIGSGEAPKLGDMLSNKEKLDKESNVAILKITNKMQHIKNRYKLDMILPSKPSQDKLSEINGMMDENWKSDLTMFDQMFEYYISKKIDFDEEIEIESWELKEVLYKSTKYYSQLMKIMQCSIKEPCRIKFYFYTDQPIKMKKTNEILKDKMLADFGSDFLAMVSDITRISLLPHEGYEKTIKVPLKPLIEKMEKEQAEIEKGKGKTE